MKVIYLTASLRSGGAERQLVETLKFFEKKEDIACEVVVMSEEIHYDYIKDLDIKIHRIIRKTKADPSIFLKFYRLFSECKPDLIHSWHSLCSMYAIPAVKLLGIKFVNNSLRDAPVCQNKKDLKWHITRLTFPFFDVIAANSYAGLDSYNVPDKKRACLHNGFDFFRIQNIAGGKKIRKLFDINTKYVVGMVASFSNKKDYKTFVDAAHMVLEKRRDITFMLIGGGNCFEEIKKRIKPKFLDHFRMPGTQKKVLNIVNIFDIGILTTNTRMHGEGIPNAVMEYMALKKPVIVTDCGGTKELVENNHTGFLVEPENPIQIANKISLLLDNNALALELGCNGYEKLVKEFSLDVMGKRIFTLYKKIMTNSEYQPCPAGDTTNHKKYCGSFRQKVSRKEGPR